MPTIAVSRSDYSDRHHEFVIAIPQDRRFVEVPDLGHAKATMRSRYGIMPQGMLGWRVELVKAIACPGLELDHLAAKAFD